MNRTIITAVGIVLAATTALKAEDKPDDGRFRFGAGISFVMLSGNNLKSGLGFGPVFTAEMKLTDRQLLWGNLEYVYFTEKDVDIGDREYWQIANSLRMGVDWVYSFDSNHRGFFAIGGIGVTNDDWKSIQFDRSSAVNFTRHNDFNSFFVVGGGYAFGRYAVDYKRAFDFAGRPAGESWEIRPSRW